MRKFTSEELHRLDIETFRKSTKVPLTLVVDNVRSMNNIGSFFRTADAFRLEEIILCGITATPPHPMIHKTALGAEESVQWRYMADTIEAVTTLKQQGYTLCALEQATHSISPEQISLSQYHLMALVVGNEVHGVQDEVIDCMDHVIEIPQYGTKHSLNVAVSAGIALYTLTAPYFTEL